MFRVRPGPCCVVGRLPLHPAAGSPRPLSSYSSSPATSDVSGSQQSTTQSSTKQQVALCQIKSVQFIILWSAAVFLCGEVEEVGVSSLCISRAFFFYPQCNVTHCDMWVLHFDYISVFRARPDHMTLIQFIQVCLAQAENNIKGYKNLALVHSYNNYLDVEQTA